jgi:phosphoribosylformimino-5-aminoimidazole carboxamide ribotide isomerase
MRFRPCIDLHQGKIKQIVGSTLKDDDPDNLQTNFTAEVSADWFAELYRRDRLYGGHVIMLGPGNDKAAAQALAAWPGGLQLGGGITAATAAGWLERGASHVIVTSWVFREGRVDLKRLEELVAEIGRERLVLDLSCRKKGEDYYIVTDRWQNFTEIAITEDTMRELAGYCDEFLIHAADVEGKCGGIDEDLVTRLAAHSPLCVTYAGGVTTIEELELIERIGRGAIDVTVGSALDIFGGPIRYDDVVKLHNMLNQKP